MSNHLNMIQYSSKNEENYELPKELQEEMFNKSNNIKKGVPLLILDFFAKNKLQEYAQKKNLGTIYYSYEFNKVNQTWLASVKIGYQSFNGNNWYKKKKDADFDAAYVALNNLLKLDKIHKIKELELSNMELDEKLKTSTEILLQKFSNIKNDFESITKDMGINFYDNKFKKDFICALTHSSALNDKYLLNSIMKYLEIEDVSIITDYNRLEFLGDSVIDLIMADVFYRTTNNSVGKMTKERVSYVNRHNMSDVFRYTKLFNYILTTVSEKELATNHIPGDVLESVIGAIFLHYGIEKCIFVLRTYFDFFNIKF